MTRYDCSKTYLFHGIYKLEPCIWNPNLIGLIQHNNNRLEVTECHNVLGTILKKDKKFTQIR